MATVNKDFKIKQGLVVEGTNATVNGNQVLTETASDQYIIDLIGGETLITSVNAGQLEVVNGELSVKTGVFDADGAADTAEQNAKTYADGLAVNYDPAGSAFDAQQNAEGYTDAQLTNYTKTSDLDTTIDGYGYLKSADLTGYATETYADNAATAAENNAKAYADELINDASNASDEVWSAYKTNTEIGLAQSAAESYADTAIANLVDSAPATLDTLNELAAALQDNPDIITDLQDIAAGKQDTLTAGSNIDITGATISVTGLDTDDVAEGSSRLYFTNTRAQDAIGAGTGLTKDGQGTELAINRQVVDTWYDAAGAASDAQTAAETFATNAINALTTDDIEEGVNNQYFTTSRAETAAKNLLTSSNLTNITITDNGQGLTITAENGVADSTTNDLVEGTDGSANGGTGNNLYFTDARAISAVSGADITPATVKITNFRKEEATNQYVSNTSTVNVHTLPSEFKTAKYLLRVVGTVSGVQHTQMSEILLTTDSNGNAAITEYGIIYTSENPLATFSTEYVGGAHKLISTTAVNGVGITAAVTMLSDANVW